MKTYLSRLVSRAQPAPPPRPAGESHAGPTMSPDPFENMVPAPPASLIPSSSLLPASARSLPFASAPAYSSADRPTDTGSSPLPAVSEMSLRPPPTVAALPSSRAAPNLGAHDDDAPLSHVLPSPVASEKPSLPPLISPVPRGVEPKPFSTEVEPSASGSEDPPSKLRPPPNAVGPGRVDVAHDAFAQLQDAADDFMARLLPRAAPPAAPSPTSLPETSPLLRPVAESRAPAPRLQPPAVPRETVPLAPPPPTVEIGRLTIEVVPPAVAKPVSPARSAPRRSPGFRNGPGLPSSARFGLGQL